MHAPPLTFHLVATLAIVAGALALFVWNRLPFEVVGLLVMSALMVLGILTPQEAIGGFSNEATLTVAAVLFLSAGLERTGVVDRLGKWISRLAGGGETRLLLVLLGTTIPLSAFLNNTAVVAMLLPVARGLGRKRGIAPSRLLMPLSFASQLGGAVTLIGTSTNLLVAGLLVDMGLPQLGLFEITPPAIPLMLAGFVYLMTVGRLLLPSRGGVDEGKAIPFREFQSVLLVEHASPFAGVSWRDLHFPGSEALRITEVRRAQRTLGPAEPLEAGDVLLVEGGVEALAVAKGVKGLCIPGVERGDEEEDDGLVLMEGIVPPRSRLIGRKARSVGPVAWQGAAVLAIQRQNERVERPGAILESGDLLLLEGTRGALHRLQRNGLILLTGSVDVRPLRRRMAWVAAGIFAAVVIVAAFGVAPILETSIVGVAAMLVTGCIKPNEAFEQMDWSVLLLLATLIPLGLAMQETDAATLIAVGVLGVTQGLGPHLVLAAVYLITSVITEFISNNAAAVLLVPVAVAVASSIGLSPMPFALAVMFAGSNSFMTPVGYQTNTFVYGPGRYRFTDFTKVGAPLSVILLLLATIVIPIFFPF